MPSASWLHRTPEGCLWGETMLLSADGTLRDGAKTGRWTGDELYFAGELDGYLVKFNRTEAEPSK